VGWEDKRVEEGRRQRGPEDSWEDIVPPRKTHVLLSEGSHSLLNNSTRSFKKIRNRLMFKNSEFD
jgi:hypothetical protein